MGFMTPDLYYNPDKFGLEVVAEIVWSEPYYDFDLTVVWIDKDGTYYWASDSGCSCPSPFEDYNRLEDANSGTKWEAINYLTSQLKDRFWNENDYATQQVANAMQKLAGRA